jgi:RND family efflux transporter MFP subunit
MFNKRVPVPRNCSEPRRKLRVTGVFLLVISAGVLGQGPPPASVRVDAARLETVQEQRMVTGDLRAVRQAEVATQEPGLVLEVAVEEGQSVRRGEVLARLDARRLELDLLDIEAQLQAAAATAQERRAEAAWRQRDLETYRSAARREASNAKELYDAEAQLAIAQARVSAAEQQIAVFGARADLFRKRLNDMTIAAPFDGIVVTKHVDPGEWLAEGDAVIALISTGAIDAWLDVPQQYAGAIIGKRPRVSISIDASGQTIESGHTRAVPRVDPKARSFSLVVRLDDPSGTMAPGMSITGWVPTGQSSERLTLSKDALLRNDAGPYVYVARRSAPQGPHAAVPTPVEVLFASKDRFVVRTQGIAPDDLIVVEGNERLFPMAPITPVAAEGEAGQGASTSAPPAALNRTGSER